MIETNWLAVFVSGIAAMVIGYIWYGPLFGKPWMKLVGRTKEEIEKESKEMWKTYGMMFVAALVTSYVLDFTIRMGEVIMPRSAMSGVMAAFWVWLGFIAAVKLSDVIFNKKPWKLYGIEVGYYFAFLLVAGVILGAWGA